MRHRVQFHQLWKVGFFFQSEHCVDKEQAWVEREGDGFMSQHAEKEGNDLFCLSHYFEEEQVVKYAGILSLQDGVFWPFLTSFRAMTSFNMIHKQTPHKDLNLWYFCVNPLFRSPCTYCFELLNFLQRPAAEIYTRIAKVLTLVWFEFFKRTISHIPSTNPNTKLGHWPNHLRANCPQTTGFLSP